MESLETVTLYVNHHDRYPGHLGGGGAWVNLYTNQLKMCLRKEGVSYYLKEMWSHYRIGKRSSELSIRQEAQSNVTLL